MRVRKYPAGTTIIQQGDLGNDFFIVKEGQVQATRYAPDAEPVSRAHEAGDYFGELALIRNEPRAATVVAMTEVSLLSMDRATFKRLMGPAEAYLETHAVRYEQLPA